MPAVIAQVAARGFGANVVSRGEWALARRAGVPNDRITLEGVGKTPADLRDAARAAATGSPLRWIALESPEEAAGARAGGPADQEGRASPRRPVPAEPGRRAGDARRARRRVRCQQVRHDRDRDRGGHRGRWRARRSAPTARHPPARRVAARCGRRLARCRPQGARDGRVVAWLDRDLRHGRPGRRVPGASDRPAGPDRRALRPRAPGRARDGAGRSSPDPSRDRTRSGARGPCRLAGRAGPPRARPGRSPGRHRRRHDRADPAGALRGAAPDRGPDVARPRAVEPGAAGPGAEPARSRARSASRRTRWARTTCRRSAGAISWPSPMPARTPRPSAPPTTGGHGRRRSCGPRMAA